MIEHLTNVPDNVVAFVCQGQVTKRDYDTVLVPAVMQALMNHNKVRLYYEIAADFSGIDSGAIWEDFKVGMKHFTRWERIAVVTDVDWIKNTIRIFSFLMPGQLRIFLAAAASQAREWIASAN